MIFKFFPENTAYDNSAPVFQLKTGTGKMRPMKAKRMISPPRMTTTQSS
jgi:hypothetical protein